MFAPARVIAVLLATARVASGRLQMAIGMGADPYIAIGRWNRETANARENGWISDGFATRVEIDETSASGPPA
jgi:hypothetical protein